MAEQRPLRWDESDLDRCEHGRHSIDSCFDCPGGNSTGNLYLLGLARGQFTEMASRLHEGLVRIGTAYDGRPIYVTPVRTPRPDDMVSTHLVEAVSAAVHERWMQAKREQGITSRQSETGEELMVPYAALSEQAKDLDRGSVVTVLECLTNLQRDTI